MNRTQTRTYFTKDRTDAVPIDPAELTRLDLAASGVLVAMDADFESKHPRGEGGRFGEGEGDPLGEHGRYSGHEVKPAAIYYHGTGLGGGRLTVGDPDWDRRFFITSKREVAEHYADRHPNGQVVEVKLKENARVFEPDLPPAEYRPERLVAVLKQAESDGYDAVNFGTARVPETVVLNLDALTDDGGLSPSQRHGLGASATVAMDADFESKHPRDHGKFANKDDGESPAEAASKVHADGTPYNGHELAVRDAFLKINPDLDRLPTIDLREVHPQLQAAIADRVGAFGDEFPGALAKVGEVHAVDPAEAPFADAAAFVNTKWDDDAGRMYLELGFNTAYFNDPERLTQAMRDGEKTGWHPNGLNTPASLVDHELGHVLDRALSVPFDREGRPSSNPVFERTALMVDKVSRYAAKDPKEAFAEVFAMRQAGVPYGDQRIQFAMQAATRRGEEKVAAAAHAGLEGPTCKGYMRATQDELAKRARAMAGDWDESKHPRGGDPEHSGRFSHADGPDDAVGRPEFDSRVSGKILGELTGFDPTAHDYHDRFPNERQSQEAKAAVASALAERMHSDPIDMVEAAQMPMGRFTPSILEGEAARAAFDQVRGDRSDVDGVDVLTQLRSDPDVLARVFELDDGRTAIQWERSGGRVQEGQFGFVSGTDPTVDQAIKEYAASSMVASWANSSNDANATSLAIQEVAADEFGLKGTAPWPEQAYVTSRAGELVAEHGDVYRDFLRAQYDTTQEVLRSKGITEIPLQRGMQWSGPDTERSGGPPQWARTEGVTTMEARPLSSWTGNQHAARAFALHESGEGASRGVMGSVVSATIPADRVLSFGRTGMGALGEHEVVVLGGPITVNHEQLGSSWPMRWTTAGTVAMDADFESKHPRDHGKFAEKGGGGGEEALPPKVEGWRRTTFDPDFAAVYRSEGDHDTKVGITAAAAAKLPPETQRELLDTINRMQEADPTGVPLRVNIVDTSEMRTKTAGGETFTNDATGASVIELNAGIIGPDRVNTGSNVGKQLAGAVSVAEYTMTHEYGHALQQARDAERESTSATRKDFVAFVQERNALIKESEPPSAYGNIKYTNRFEAYAEAYSDWRLSPEPGELATRLAEHDGWAARSAAVAASGDFDESKHPRGGDPENKGRFSNAEGSGNELGELKPAKGDPGEGRDLLKHRPDGSKARGAHERDDPERVLAKVMIATDIADRMAHVDPVDMVAAAYPPGTGFTLALGDPVAEVESRLANPPNEMPIEDVLRELRADPDLVVREKDLGVGGAVPGLEWERRDALTADQLHGQGWEPGSSPKVDGWLREAAVSQMVGAWAGTSNDRSALMLTLQDSAVKEFGLTGTAGWFDHPIPDGYREQVEPVQREFLRAMYDNTQDYLRENGITELRLTRGFDWDSPDEVPTWAQSKVGVDDRGQSDVTFRPLNSFAGDRDDAINFAFGGQYGAIVAATVPAERIIGTARTGFGALPESEFVVLGGTDRVTVQPLGPEGKAELADKLP